ncbi:hypothetical protein EVAR_28275_1 [Eumeta japonica]|uniref:Uncharacterized protein n=1 Tax=Eumeta variegata TaxID=151549 RepID=A0A4C1V6J6_EUMVA|nr:hypothetical protein EVAR_28275_1 [Eumeta japonica]
MSHQIAGRRGGLRMRSNADTTSVIFQKKTARIRDPSGETLKFSAGYFSSFRRATYDEIAVGSSRIARPVAVGRAVR